MTRRIRTALVAAAAAAIVLAATASQGAYFSQSWGWVALAFLGPATVLLLLGVVEVPGALRAAFALLVTALGIWIALSATWSLSPSSSVREAERVLVYVAVALAVALVLRRGDAGAVAAGAFAGVAAVSSYALATRLFPDRFETYDDPDLPYRLSAAVGYWNALGLLVVVGALVALGISAHGRRLWHRALAGAALPVLAATLYFTFSRGAWAALALGLVVAVALDPRRLELLLAGLVVGPVSVAAIADASRREALTTEGAPQADALAQGHGLAFRLAVLVCVSGLLAVAFGLAARRVAPPRWLARAVDGALAAGVVACVVVGLVLAGGPRKAAGDLVDRFDAPIAVRDPADLNARLFSLSGTGRSDSIAVAWDAAAERRLVGHGAGSFEYVWYERRPGPFVIRDAHSLYAEMLAEVGLVGSALLGLALLVPLVAAVRARRVRLVPAAAGAYVAWLAHSALDWDWEVVGVTVTAMLAGAVALLAAERGPRRVLPESGRVPLTGIAVALSLLAVVSLVGNQALFAAREAVARQDWVAALDDARRAERLLPWSHEPAVVLGDAAAGLGDRQAALRAYRDAVATDRLNWVVWLRLAQVARGAEREVAYRRVRTLNPREEELPGERRRGSGS